MKTETRKCIIPFEIVDEKNTDHVIERWDKDNYVTVLTSFNTDTTYAVAIEFPPYYVSMPKHYLSNETYEAFIYGKGDDKKPKEDGAKMVTYYKKGEMRWYDSAENKEQEFNEYYY